MSVLLLTISSLHEKLFPSSFLEYFLTPVALAFWEDRLCFAFLNHLPYIKHVHSLHGKELLSYIVQSGLHGIAFLS